MSSMDPMKGGSWILSETMRKTSLRPSRLQQLRSIKSSSLMRQITQPQMYNSPYGHLLRSLLGTVDLSSPVTTRTRSSLPSIPGVPSLTSPSKEKTDKFLQDSSSKDSNKSWIQRLLNMSQKFLQNSATSISLTGDGSSMSVKDIRLEDKSTQVYSLRSQQ